MKVLQIVNSLECGGLENLVVELSKGLRDGGIKTDILCLGTRGELAVLAEREGIAVFCFNKKEGFNPLVICQIFNFIRKNKYDLIHTHNLAPLIYGSPAARLAGIKCINTRHGRERKFTHRYIWQMNSLVAVVSGDAEAELMKHNCMSQTETRVIYNGIDIDKYRKIEDGKRLIDKRKELGLGNDEKVIGIVARLAIEKDHETLLKAVAKLVQDQTSSVNGSKLRLLIVGDGPLGNDLKESVKRSGLEGHVTFMGFREDIAELLQIFDIFLLSSTQEGISLTLLEAMAASIPVVATYVGGNPEVVAHGQTGLLVPAKDPQKMADAIMEILNDPDKARRMGEAGRKRVEEKFCLERMVAEYEEVYREVLGKK